MSDTQTWCNQEEHRYELERTIAQKVLSELNQHLPVLRYKEAPATTLIATVYFDSPDHYYLNRAKKNALNMTQTSSIKIRAREYFPISDDVERRILGQSHYCYLERKERRGNIRDKERVRIAKPDLAQIIAGKSKATVSFLAEEIQNKNLQPVLISMYERRVWGSDDALRITFDERIRYYAPPDLIYGRLSAMNPSELGPPTAIGAKRILEVKYQQDTPIPTWLSALLNEIPEIPSFSKFLEGMKKTKTNGSLRQSKFRNRLTTPCAIPKNLKDEKH